MPNTQWTILYFGICFDCDYSILETIEMNWFFGSIYAIWCRLPENYSSLDLISPVQEMVNKFQGSWRYHRSTRHFQICPKVKYYDNVCLAIEFLQLEQIMFITEFSQIDYDQSSWVIQINHKNEIEVNLYIGNMTEVVTDKFLDDAPLKKKILRAHYLLKEWKKKILPYPDY